MAADDPRKVRRTVWRSLGGTIREEGVPLLGSVVKDGALAFRPGRVVDWDGDQVLTLEPPTGRGESWAARLDQVELDRSRNGAGTWAAGVYEQLDGDPLPLPSLAAALRALTNVVREEVEKDGRARRGGHNIMTATDVLRDRHRFGTALAGVPVFNDAARLQVARAVCTVTHGRVPDDPMASLVKWQSGVVQEPGQALARVCESAAERLEAAVAISRAQAALAMLEDGGDGSDAVDDQRL